MKKTNLVIISILIVLTCQVVVKAADAGSIISWGAVAFDSKELDANDFIAIAAGYNHSLALKSDGSIVGWGSNV